MKTYITHADVAAIRIFTKDACFYFSNNNGDGRNIVHIYDSQEERENAVQEAGDWDAYKFAGSFDVLTPDSVFLSDYDCNRDAVHCFDKSGRYFVFLDKLTMTFDIYWLDNDVCN